MSAYDFIDDGNPVRTIDVFVDALDLAEMSFEGEPAATGPPSYHPSFVFLQEFPRCEFTTTSSWLPAFHGHTLSRASITSHDHELWCTG